MAQTDALIRTLQRVLKLRGLTYRDVARALQISEASVKRLFSTRAFSLERLEKVLDLAQTSLSELVRQMEAEQRSLDELTEAQERELTADPALLLVAFVVINGWHYEDIVRDYRFTPHELVQYLARLDRLKMIDLLPNNRIQLRISPRFRWRRNGPIERFFTEHLRQNFLASRFAGDDETQLFLTGVLTAASRTQLQEHLDELAHRFHELNYRDRHLPLDQRRLCSLLLAMRPWRPTAFDRFLQADAGSGPT